MASKIVLHFFLTFITVGQLFAQSAADVDTFTVNGAQFVATTPSDWFSVSVKDSIQKDTTWNYKMRYSPKENSSNVYAEIWIHIIGNSKIIPTKKQERQFKKKCDVSETILGNWGAYFLNYRPTPIRKCKECGMLYTQLYSIPLNFDQSMEIVFVAQGQRSSTYAVEIKFPQIASQFVKANDNSLNRFRIIDFTLPFSKDTFEVDDYNLNAIAPYGFTKFEQFSRKINDPVYRQKSSYTISSQHDFIRIYVTGEIISCDSGTSLPIIDTTLVHEQTTSFNEQTQFNTFITKRLIPVSQTKGIVVTFVIETRNIDLAWELNLKCALREYANKFVIENQRPQETLRKLEFRKPETPLKPFDVPIGKEKENKLEKGLPKPKQTNNL